jgi:hypothetical protein
MYQKSRKMQCSKPGAMTWLADFQQGVVEYRSTGVVEWWNVATIGIWECGFVKEGLLSNLDETPLLPLNCAYL